MRGDVLMAIEPLMEQPAVMTTRPIEPLDELEERVELGFAHQFVPPDAMKFLAGQRSLAVASRARSKQVWCSLLTGLTGFIFAPIEDCII
jgi:hypothetical protein